MYSLYVSIISSYNEFKPRRLGHDKGPGTNYASWTPRVDITLRERDNGWN